MLLLRVNGNGNWRRGRTLRITHRTRGSLIERRSSIEFLVIAIAPAAGSWFRATTVRVRGSPLRRLHDLTVAVIQARLIGPQTLMLRRLIHSRAVNRIVPLVVGHRAFTGHRNVRRDRAFPIIRIRRRRRVLVGTVRQSSRFWRCIRINRLSEFSRHRLHRLNVARNGMRQLLRRRLLLLR